MPMVVYKPGVLGYTFYIMLHDSLPKPQKFETAQDFDKVAKAMLKGIRESTTTLSGAELIELTCLYTGYESEPVKEIFQSLGALGIFDISPTDEQSTVALTEAGIIFERDYDASMSVDN